MSATSSTGTDPTTMSALALARAVRERQLSAREVATAHLARIAAHDKGERGLNAFLRVDEAGALAAADAVDARVARGEDPGALAGVPVGLKDLFVTEGLETTCASKILQGWIPPYDGTAVARLRAAGAVILGKLNMDEFAMGSSNENSAFGPCRNPWDPTRVTGGSSGGSAAAVAAGFCPITLGTDTGGSIRQPAALTGVLGIKPTYGRVSRYGVVAFASSLDQVGPFAGCIEDLALALEVISGHDPLDSTSIVEAPPALGPALAAGAQGLAGLTIGLPREYFIAGTDAEVDAAVRAAIRDLESLGARVIDVSLPHTEHALATYYLIAPAECSSNLARFDGVRYGRRVQPPGGDLADMYQATREAGFGDEVKRRIMLGTYALRSGYYDAYYRKAQQVRTLIADDFRKVFTTCDAVATPTSPTAAFKIGEKTADPVQMYLADVFTLSCNLAGLPGMSIPCGFTSGGLPIGLQLLGRPLGEAALFQLAAAYAARTDHARRRPTLEAA